MRPPEFTGGNLEQPRWQEARIIGASMRPPEFTGGNLQKVLDAIAWVFELQ